MALKIEMLRAFCTVAQTGNLSEAADRLGISPRTLRYKVARLRDEGIDVETMVLA